MGANPEGFEDRPVPVRPLDEEQARLVEILRSAGARPVSFEELRSRGIDNPAVLCYELEIAGLPIRHVERLHVGGAAVPVGVQLDEPWLTGDGAVPHSRGLDTLLARWTPASQSSRRAAAASSRALVTYTREAWRYTRQAARWLAAHVGWLLIVASSWLADRAGWLATNATSWLEGRMGAWRSTHPPSSSQGRMEAWRSTHPPSSSQPVEVPHEDVPPPATQAGRGFGERQRDGGAVAGRERREPPQEWREPPRERREPPRERREPSGHRGASTSAAAWLSTVSVLASRLVASSRKRVDSVVQASGVQVRARDLKDRRHLEAWVVAAVLGVLAVSGLAIALGSSSSGVPAKVAAGRHVEIPASAKSLGASRAVSRRRHPSARPSSRANSAGASTSAPANAHGGGSEGSKSASQLQAEGHQLLLEGRYGAAAADLRAALRASGVSTGRCQAPTSEGCLTYAYALYDLGRALQLEHRPGAAVPVLNERLRIDNQRPTVRSELNTARHQLHHTATPPESSNSTPRQSGGHEPRGPTASPHRPDATGESGSAKKEAGAAPQSHPPAAPGGENSRPTSGPTSGPGSGSEAHNGGAAG